MIALPACMLMIFCYAPIEKNQGLIQKVFYLHLGYVASMYVSIFLGMLFAILYLVSKYNWCDLASAAANEVGFLFISGVLASGMIWAKPVWGAWWTWDPRLTTTLLIWLVYAAYMLVRYNFSENDQARKWSAILSVIGFLNVPVIHYSVRFLRGIHPVVITKGGITAKMGHTVIFSIVVFLVLMTVMILLKFRYQQYRTKAQQMVHGSLT